MDEDLSFLQGTNFGDIASGGEAALLKLAIYSHALTNHLATYFELEDPTERQEWLRNSPLADFERHLLEVSAVLDKVAASYKLNDASTIQQSPKIPEAVPQQYTNYIWDSEYTGLPPFMYPPIDEAAMEALTLVT